MTPTPPTGGFIPWEGGECPVDAGTRVEVRFRDPEILSSGNTRVAASFDWSHIYSGGQVGASDIIAYRIVGEAS